MEEKLSLSAVKAPYVASISQQERDLVGKLKESLEQALGAEQGEADAH